MRWANFLYSAGPMLLALAVYVSPLNRERQRRKAVNARLYGSAVVFDRHGNPINPGTETIFTQLEKVNAKLDSAALLNGKGEQLIADISETRRLLASHITDSEHVHAALWSSITETKRHR